MKKRVYAAASIDDPQLCADYQAAYKRYRRDNMHRYLNTALIETPLRPFIWSIFAFAARSREVLIAPGSKGRDKNLTTNLDLWQESFLQSVTGHDRENIDEPIARAMAHTMRNWNISRTTSETFFTALRNEHYAADHGTEPFTTFAELQHGCLVGSGAVATQVLAVLEPADNAAIAHARTLGEACHFAELVFRARTELMHGTSLLPIQDVELFGVNPQHLAEGKLTLAVRELLDYETQRARGLFDFAEAGLDPVSVASTPAVQGTIAAYRAALAELQATQFMTKRNPAVRQNKRGQWKVRRQARAIRRRA